MLKASEAAISVACPSCSTQYLLPRAKCPEGKFQIQCKRCRGEVEVDPTLVRAEKHAEVDGVRIELEGHPDEDAWRVLVNGKPAIMTFSETETTVTNAGSYDKTPREPERVQWAPLQRVVASDAPFEATRSERGIRVQCDIIGSKAVMYNTVIYDSERLVIDIEPDLSRATVTFQRHTDSSS